MYHSLKNSSLRNLFRKKSSHISMLFFKMGMFIMGKLPNLKRKVLKSLFLWDLAIYNITRTQYMLENGKMDYIMDGAKSILIKRILSNNSMEEQSKANLQDQENSSFGTEASFLVHFKMESSMVRVLIKVINKVIGGIGKEMPLFSKINNFSD